MFAPEGLGFIAIPLGLLIVFVILALKKKRLSWILLSVLSLIVSIMMLFFFRDPARELPDSASIVAPTDGLVVSIDSTSTGGIRVAVFLSLFDVHAIRSPVSGKIASAEDFPGKFHPAYAPESSIENEHVRIEIDTPDGIIVMRVIAGMVARRIVCHLKPGEQVFPGKRAGFIRFGSRSELEFPPGFVSAIKTGDRLIGGVTQLGSFQLNTDQNPKPGDLKSEISTPEADGA
ncbi:MAG: phosphatidylserine decarboxylase [Candidatus Electryonea clarkiae]|nr:phosphatidylserine decarboxylase [Candidatus Electryonea clarkiae]MDP8286346.1 phosphatidylserine decarboxylase [Candidatus Electryonea clarkiae]